MNKDLGLTTGNRYSLVTLIFFIPYVVFQPPATVILRKVGPRLFLAVIVISWGATMIVSYPHAVPFRHAISFQNTDKNVGFWL